MRTLGALLLALAVLARLAGRVGLSPIPLYLVVGLLVGEHGPFDLSVSEDFTETAAAVGVALLLFLLYKTLLLLLFLTFLLAHSTATTISNASWGHYHVRDWDTTDCRCPSGAESGFEVSPRT